MSVKQRSLMQPWRLMVFAILGATAVLNIIVYLAAHSDPSQLIEDRPYERSLDYDQVIEAKKRFTTGGYRVTVETVTGNSVDGTLAEGKPVNMILLKIMITGSSGGGIDGLAPQVELLRAAGDVPDINVAPSAVPQESGSYQCGLPGIRSGIWLLKVRFVTADGPVIFEDRLLVK